MIQRLRVEHLREKKKSRIYVLDMIARHLPGSRTWWPLTNHCRMVKLHSRINAFFWCLVTHMAPFCYRSKFSLDYAGHDWCLFSLVESLASNQVLTSTARSHAAVYNLDDCNTSVISSNDETSDDPGSTLSHSCDE